jgi:serine/threonine protein kinase
MRIDGGQAFESKTPSSVEKVEMYRPLASKDQGDKMLMEMIIEAAVNEILEHKARKINEGQNGIIFRLEGVAEEVSAKLASAGYSVSNEQIAKVLKISKKGAGEHEYRMQQKALHIIESSVQDDSVSFAKVPTLHGYCELPITEEVRKKLQVFGFDSSNKRADIIFMDYIDGPDLATALYREVVKRHPRTVHLKDSVHELDFQELHKEVSSALGFTMPGGKARDANERIIEQYRIMQMNMERLVVFLNKSGFRLNPSIPKQISATIDLFHKNGLCLRDAHHRNFLVEGDIEAGSDGEERPCKVYAIDFGSAVEFDGRYMEDVYIDNVSGSRFPNDETIVAQLRQFVLKKELSSIWGKDESLHRRIESSEQFKQFASHASRAYSDGHASLQELYHRCPMQPSRSLYFLSFVDAFVKVYPDQREHVIDEIERLSVGVPILDSNALRRYASYLAGI